MAMSTRAAFTRYRIMAWITGAMLLLLCLEMVLKYVFHAGGVQADGSPAPVLGTWVAMAHGAIYVFYLLAAFDMWSRIRWGLGRMVLLIIAGLIPFLSFIMEAFAHRWFLAEKADGGEEPSGPGGSAGGGRNTDEREDSAPAVG